MPKDTSKIIEELALCPDFQTFYEENQDHMVTESLADMLNALVDEHGLSKATIIRRSEISESYAYQIFSGLRIPDRKRLISLAMGMDLSSDTVQQVLKCAGYPPLYAKRPFDSIVLYGLHKKLPVSELNELLLQYGQEMLV